MHQKYYNSISALPQLSSGLLLVCTYNIATFLCPNCILQAAMMFQKMVADAKSVRVTDVTRKEERKARPHGLNTVDMLKVCIPTKLTWSEHYSICCSCWRQLLILINTTWLVTSMLSKSLLFSTKAVNKVSTNLNKRFSRYFYSIRTT